MSGGDRERGRSVFCSVLCPPSADLLSSLRKQQQIDVRANKRGRPRRLLPLQSRTTHARGEPASELLYSTRDRIQCDELVYWVVIASLTRGHDITISWAFFRSTLEFLCVFSTTMHRNSVVRFMETLSWPSISHPGCHTHKSASFLALM